MSTTSVQQTNYLNYTRSHLSSDDQKVLATELHRRIADQITTMNREWLEYQGSEPLERVKGALWFLKDQKFEWPMEEILPAVAMAQENGDIEIAQALLRFWITDSTRAAQALHYAIVFPNAIPLILESEHVALSDVRENLRFAMQITAIRAAQMIAESKLLTEWYFSIIDQFEELHECFERDTLESARNKASDLIYITAFKGDVLFARGLVQYGPLTYPAQKNTLFIATYTGNLKLTNELLRLGPQYSESTISGAKKLAAGEDRQEICALLDNYFSRNFSTWDT